MKTHQSSEPSTRQSRRLSRTAGTSSRQPARGRSRSLRTTSEKPSSRAPKPTQPILAAPSAPFVLTNPTAARPSRRNNPSADLVRSYSELISALKDKKVQITLGNNIIVPNNILIDYDVAINLNGHCLISEQETPNARVIDIRRGEITLTGSGKIFAMGPNSTAIRLFGAISASMPHYTQLTIDEKVQVYAPDGNGIVISANLGVAYGVTLNFAGKIIAKNGVCLSQSVRGQDAHQPKINIKSGSLIIADEESGVDIDAAGIGNWQIGAAKIFGFSGLRAKAGTINLEHTQIISHQPAIEVDATADPNLSITIENGVYASESDHAIAGKATQIAKLRISNGDFCSTKEALSDQLSTIATIQDGNFSNDVLEYMQQFTIPDFSESQVEDQSHSGSAISAPSVAAISLDPVALPSASAPEVSSDTGAADAEPIAPKPEPSSPIPTNREAQNQKNSALATKKPSSAKKSNSQKASAERESLLANFSDAIESMQNLRAEDYASGFSEFELALATAEEILDDPSVSITEIRDAADQLLSAFDRLEERDELSLTDDELDQLFYHGAILQEVTDSTDSMDEDIKRKPSRTSRRSTKDKVAKPKLSLQNKPKTKTPKIAVAPPAPAMPEIPQLEAIALESVVSQLESIPSNSAAPQPKTIPSNQVPSELTNPAPTSIAMQVPEATIAEFQQAPVATRPAPAPVAILHDDYKPALQSAHTTKSQPSPTRPVATIEHPSTPATPSLSSCLIDELTPLDQWMTGVAMIDELAPLSIVQTPATQSKPRKKPPFTNFVKSLAVGVQTGFEAFHKTRQNAKNS